MAIVVIGLAVVAEGGVVTVPVVIDCAATDDVTDGSCWDQKYKTSFAVIAVPQITAAF